KRLERPTDLPQQHPPRRHNPEYPHPSLSEPPPRTNSQTRTTTTTTRTTKENQRSLINRTPPHPEEPQLSHRPAHPLLPQPWESSLQEPPNIQALSHFLQEVHTTIQRSPPATHRWSLRGESPIRTRRPS